MSTSATLALPRRVSTGGPIHLLMTAYRSLQARIEQFHETEHLAGLDDRLLADMGLARRDIAKLFR